MNRADKLLSVLRDGQPHSRQDIFDRVGYMLTNNAASELRARGIAVEQSCEWANGRNVFYYRLAASLNGEEPQNAPATSTDAEPISEPPTGVPSSSPFNRVAPLDPLPTSIPAASHSEITCTGGWGGDGSESSEPGTIAEHPPLVGAGQLDLWDAA